jgi:hypothetical protein
MCRDVSTQHEIPIENGPEKGDGFLDDELITALTISPWSIHRTTGCIDTAIAKDPSPYQNASQYKQS